MQTKTLGSAGGGFFWTLTAIACGLIAGGIFGYVISFFSEASPSSGIIFGALIFVVTSWVFGRFAMGGALPPPNSLPIPTAPPGGRYTIPGGAPSRPPSEPKPLDPHDLGVSVGETLASARSRITEVMSSAGLVAGDGAHRASGDDEARPSEHADERPAEATAAEVPQPAVETARAAEPEDGGYEPAYPVGAPEGTAEETAAAPAPVEPAPAEETAAAPEAGVEPHAPPRFDAPREGGADDLKRVSGIGPELEDKLHGLGIFHYAQIAAWTPAETAWIDATLGSFQGRVARDGWVEQAARLAAGEAPRGPDGAGE